MLTAKHLVIAAITLLLAGCKMAVIVVEGGELQSTGSGTCVAGTVCLIDVADTEFSETFTAIPDDGWYFQKWNKGERFFCASSAEWACSLSFQGYEEPLWLQEIVASSEVFYLMPIFKPYRDIVSANRKEWLQPALFLGLSWSEINAVCPEGVCKGMLNGVDLNGWTWASLDEIRSLFDYYIGEDVLGVGGNYYWQPDSNWAPRFFSDGWVPSVEAEQILEGWTSDLYADPNEPNNANFAVIHNRGIADEHSDEIRIGWDGIDTRHHGGGWFWRPRK